MRFHFENEMERKGVWWVVVGGGGWWWVVVVVVWWWGEGSLWDELMQHSQGFHEQLASWTFEDRNGCLINGTDKIRCVGSST